MKSVNVVVTASELRQDGAVYKRGDVLAVSEQEATDLAAIGFVRATTVSPEAARRYSRRDMQAKR